MSDGVPLQRDGSRGKLIIAAVINLVACPLLAWIIPQYPNIGFIGAIATFAVGVSLLEVAFEFKGRGPCPHCRNELRGLAKNDTSAFCPRCGDASVVKDGRIAAMPRETVIAVRFPLHVEREQMISTDGRCVSCAAASTTNAVLFDQFHVTVPVCDFHTGHPGVTLRGRELRIASYRAWRVARPHDRS